VIIWPRQLAAINRLAAQGEVSEMQLIAMPLSVQVTMSYTDGTHLIKLLDMDGKERRLNEVFGNKS
jgi:hypothetical protein